jgi:hypothetical protein
MNRILVKWMFVLARALVFVYLLLRPLCVSAGELRAQVLPLPNHGSLHLSAPPSWHSKVTRPAGDLPPTFEFTPVSGSGFKVLVTPLWSNEPGAAHPSLALARKTVEHAATAAMQQSVESQLPLKDLKGHAVAGYYFSATDRAPEPGGYKHLTQGALVLGDLLVTFTALTNDGSEDATREALAALAGATYDPPGPASAGVASSEDGQAVKVTELEADYLVTHPESSLLLCVPKSNLRLEAGRGEGMNPSPRYFIFKDLAGGLVLSGWFEPEQRFPGLAKQWVEDVRSWSVNGLPEPRDMAIGWTGGWETVFYDTSLGGVHTSHVRAECTQSGTWIDLHLSLTADEPSEALRSRLRMLLAALEVKKK